MGKSLLDVIAEADAQNSDSQIQVVRDGPIFYLVFNNKDTEDFQFTIESLAQLNAALDIIDRDHKQGEPACMVTITSSPNKWCTGFDIPNWVDEGPACILESYCRY